MSFAIIGETIKSATSLKLGQIFNNPKRYKENITRQEYPNFHIVQVNVVATPTTRGRLQLDYLMNIQYRVAENTELINNLQQHLDEVGFKLCSELTELDLERPTPTKNRNYQKADGVLQMFFDITVFVTPEKTEDEKFKEYELNEEVIEDGRW